MRKYLSMVLTFVAVSTLPVAAATQQDLDWCSEKGNPTLDQQIESCTGVIESGVFSQQVLGLVFNNRAVALSQKGQYDRALEDYDRALRLAPTHVDAWIGRAFIFKQKGQYARAVQDYDQAIRLDPNRPTSFYDRGITFQLNGQHDRAIPDFNEAIRLDPKFPRAYSSRGNSYGLLRQSDRALQDFDQAIRFEPNYPYPYSNRAAIYKAQGERDRAIADWRKVLTLMPDESLRNRAEAELRELGGSGAADDATCFTEQFTI